MRSAGESVLADADVDLAALLLDRRILDRERDRHVLAILVESTEKVEMVVERIVGGFGAQPRTTARADPRESS